MGIAITLATMESVFIVFRVTSFPMPQLESDMAIKWKVKATYSGISENKVDTAFSTENDHSRCIGSTRYQIFSDERATESGHESRNFLLRGYR